MIKIKPFAAAFILVLLNSCAAPALLPEQTQAADQQNADKLYVVDCLLPGQIRKLGQLASYLTARRPIKTTASDCEIRGGEYVAYDRASYATALKVWLPRAQSGDAEAQAYVGEIYEKGMGLPPDYQLAAQWYRKAAAQGNTRAQINLGYLYEKGLGVPKDRQMAFAWYKKSSGLDKTNIPYAATLETAPENPLSQEVTFLKTDLKNSRNEAKALTKQLHKTKNKIRQQQQQLIAANAQLEKSKALLNSSSTSTDPVERSRLQALITGKEQEISQQQKNIASLESQYQQKVQSLQLKLQETEKRARQIAENLKTQQSTAYTAQLKLLQTEAKLASTKQQLYQLQQNSVAKLPAPARDASDPLSKNQNNFAAKQQELKKIQTQLKANEQKKTQQMALIQELQAEKNAYAKKIAQLQDRLNTTHITTAEIKTLNKDLQQQKQAAQEFTGQLKKKQLHLAATEQKLTALQKRSKQEQQQLQTLKKNIALLQQNVTASSAEKADLQRQLQAQADKELQQQNLIAQLETEKLQYETTIKQLQKKVNTEASGNKPQIEIIDPPFVLVRGTPTVTLRSVVKQREIIGKVTSPAELLSLTVNDTKERLDDQGLFQTNVQLTQAETPVKVVAIDKNGKRAALDFILSLGNAIKISKRTMGSGHSINTERAWESLDFGKYYALVIGNNKYRKVPRLDTPVNDARDIEKVLRTKYGFKTTLLLNATRYQILSALNKLRNDLNEKDNLLIYYAGHGELDKVNMRGNWLPVDAEADNTANWISTIAITDILNMMSVKHILVVSDSCYSGAMTRSALARLDAGNSGEKKSEWLKAMLKARSRTVLTSGGLKPVMDGGGGKHSVFANAFIKALQANNGLLEGQALYRKVSARIVAIAAGYGIEQVPEYAPIRHSGHESGEFFFVPKG